MKNHEYKSLLGFRRVPYALLGSLVLFGGCARNDGANGPSSAANGGISSAVGFPGSGAGFAGAPLSAGEAPDTATACLGTPPVISTTQVVSQSMTCFYSADLNPAASVEEILETLSGKKVVHIRVTFNPDFVDNTYGDNAVGWGTTTTSAAVPTPPNAGPGMGMGMGMGMGAAPAPMGPKGKGGHSFDDLVGSDHVELKLFDGKSALSFDADVDYISQDATRPCGYGTLGVTGGDGKVIVGSASDVIAVATSLDRDLNGCGYCLTESSPATDASYTPNAATPFWDYRVVYELWVDAATFGSAGFGYAVISTVHASPSKKSSDTIDVTPKNCPPSFTPPVCEPGTIVNGVECSSGADAGGVCPPGTVPDLASEGKFCVPV
jgi:hypothetical protein